jgi:putative iron-regulated protein
MKHALLTALLFALSLSPCTAQTIDRRSVAEHYAAVVHANYEDTLAAAKNMQKEIHAFLAQPSEAALASSRKSWLAARDVYGQTEAFRFYAGPIDDDKGPEGRINAWPLDESYIDAVQGKPTAGIVNNPKIAITKKRLSALNERGGEENIATGWHAIEFMLWGQDRNEAGPGNRSFEDFIDGKAPNAKRRQEYLKVVADLLIDDLTLLVTAWAPNAKNYRARFIANENEAVRRMLVGLGSLSRGELAGERLEVALASQDQEDEHSCFSDNTHRDVIANATGIQNVWLGRYKRVNGTMLEGPSLKDLVASKNPGLAEKSSNQIGATVTAANAIQPPFDQEIRGDNNAPGRKRVQATIDALKQQSRNLVESANAIGITKLTLVDPGK